jgi:hypothetical protein
MTEQWMNSQYKEKITIGNHNIDCVGAIKESRYRVTKTGKYDGINLIGSSGHKAYTNSVINILKFAHLTSPDYVSHQTCPQTRYQKQYRQYSESHEEQILDVVWTEPGKPVMWGCLVTPPQNIYDDDLPIPQYDGNMTLDSISENERENYSIPVIVSATRPAKLSASPRKTANISIKYKSKTVFTATQLPVVVNLNPRSVYNKKKVIQMDGYQVVKNVLQRSGKGGKPALIIKM